MKKIVIFTLGLIMGFSILALAQDSFDPHQPLTLTPHIGTVEIRLKRTVNPSEGNPQSIKFVVMVDDQFHNHMDVRNGDLIPHLTITQKDQLIAFMDTMWQKAEDEILP